MVSEVPKLRNRWDDVVKSSMNPGTSSSNNITLTPSTPDMMLVYNSSEPFCDSPPCSCNFGTCDYTCEVNVASPPGTILKATFLDLHVPSDDQITFINRNNSHILLRFSGISSAVEPVYVDSSVLRITFQRCDSNNPYSYLQAQFSYLDQTPTSPILSSGGAFVLSDTSPSITIQSVNLSSLTNLAGDLHWFITTTSAIWIQVDLLVMDPGQDGDLCILDTFDTFGQWVCITGTTPSTTWYSYDDELRIAYYINSNTRPGVGFTIRLSIVDHSSWTGQSLTIPGCNPTVNLQETSPTIRFTTPYFNQSLQNVQLQCRMRFSSDDSARPPSIQFNHFDIPGDVSVYGSPGFLDLADATRTSVAILPGTPVVSRSLTRELYVDITKSTYTDDGEGVMVQPYTDDFATRGPDPISSFGIALELNDTSSPMSFTTLGYPTLPGGEINVRWYIHRVIADTAIKVEFVDFHIGTATLFVHVLEDSAAILTATGSNLPDDIYSTTTRLELLLRAVNVCCSRGIHFNVSLIILVNECANSPCHGGATCVDEWESFHCVCPPTYTGELCQYEIPTTSGVASTQETTEITTTSGDPSTQETTTGSTSSPTVPGTTTPSASTQSNTASTTTHAVTRMSTTSVSTSRRTEPLNMKTTTELTSAQTSTNGNRTTVDSSKGGDNGLIIGLSVSLLIAVVVIVSLIGAFQYHSNKRPKNSETPNPYACSTSELVPPGANHNQSGAENPGFEHRYSQGPHSHNLSHTYMRPSMPDPVPFDPPPAYEELPNTYESSFAAFNEYEAIPEQPIGSGGGQYMELNRITRERPRVGGEYESLKRDTPGNPTGGGGSIATPNLHAQDDPDPSHEYLQPVGIIRVSPAPGSSDDNDSIIAAEVSFVGAPINTQMNNGHQPHEQTATFHN